jgi:hypothetical protein
VAGAKKYKYNTKYNTETYNTKYTPASGVFSFPDPDRAHRASSPPSMMFVPISRRAAWPRVLRALRTADAADMI